jgi:pimeloyl-ACP methyl ester carboxylesterase
MDGTIANPSEIAVRAMDVGVRQQEYQPITLETHRGIVACRYFGVRDSRSAAIWVGGVGGGWDTPARGLYPDLCRQLMDDGISSLRVRFRHPSNLKESTLDVLAGIDFLSSQHLDTLALVGHSFGGAVVIQATVAEPVVCTVVTLATQSYGADVVSRFPPETSILLIHGTDDRILSPENSEYVYRLAREPKRLILYPGAGHSLDKVAKEVHQVVRDWIISQLNDAEGSAGSR